MSKSFKDRTLLAIIGDEDSVTGMLLAGIGNVNEDTNKSNFTVVDHKVDDEQLAKVFNDYTSRSDIAILLINQHIADRIRYQVDSYQSAFPALLEIPSKDHPYDPEKDSVLKRVRRLFGN